MARAYTFCFCHRVLYSGSGDFLGLVRIVPEMANDVPYTSFICHCVPYFFRQFLRIYSSQVWLWDSYREVMPVLRPCMGR